MLKKLKKQNYHFLKQKKFIKSYSQIDETESNFTLQPEKQKALADRKKRTIKYS